MTRVSATGPPVCGPTPAQRRRSLPAMLCTNMLRVACALAGLLGLQDPKPAPSPPSNQGVPAGDTVAFFHENGVKAREGHIVHGRREGVWKGWYDNGSPQYEGVFRNYHREGPWTYWETSGKKRMEGSWTAGLRSGKWTFFQDNG